LKAKSTALDTLVVKVSAVGAGMINEAGVAARMFKALSKNKINIHMISTSEIRISCIVNSKEGPKAVQVIHDEFELDKVTD
ncbi:MAG TPA: ACT domain-containing protein, partial [Vampirovibrionales bacterium]